MLFHPCANLALTGEERDVGGARSVDKMDRFLRSCDSRDDYCDSADKAK